MAYIQNDLIIYTFPFVYKFTHKYNVCLYRRIYIYVKLFSVGKRRNRNTMKHTKQEKQTTFSSFTYTQFQFIAL